MQLVELQRSVAGGSADPAVYAISYDPPDVLRRFAELNGITYPLLSDVGSRVITELNMLNRTIEQDQAAHGKPFGERHAGLPYPGAFVLDAGGRVISRRFERSHRVRPAARSVLAGAFGSSPVDGAGAEFPGGSLTAWVDTVTVNPNQVQDAHVRIHLDPGHHVYTEPVPAGFTALDLRVGGDPRVEERPADIPRGVPFRIDGLDEEFHVLEGTTEASRPFLVASPEADVSDQPRQVRLELEARFQVCTASTCDPPLAIRLPFELQLIGFRG